MMKTIYRTHWEIKLRNGDKFVSEVKESEYSWKNDTLYTQEELLINSTINIELSKATVIHVKPSDILYTIRHQSVAEIEDEDTEE